MEIVLETECSVQSAKQPVISEHHATPSPIPKAGDQTTESSPNPGVDLRKSNTPDRLLLPKAFKHPERYRSPTDSMMSPVTKGLLLARARRGGSLLPPSKNFHQIQDLRLQDPGLLREINS